MYSCVFFSYYDNSYKNVYGPKIPSKNQFYFKIKMQLKLLGEFGNE